MKPMARKTSVLILEAPLGSDLYQEALALREAILRAPLGLTVSEDELRDDAMRQHFCAIEQGAVVGTISLRPLDETTLHLKQMAVARARRAARVGTQLLTHAEAWGTKAGFRLMIMHARAEAIGFYMKHGYAQEGIRFIEQTIPHIRLTKKLT